MSRVKMNKEGIFIDGNATVILCGSLFYYRIPNELWEDRLIKIKAAGYNCIDVYFPWNFHELNEGVWDFEGIRDVEQFLKLAKKYDLLIMARPGPYICGEWDGGGLPSFLFTKGMKLRDNDPIYLQYVEEWYKRIIPMIAKYQVDQEGTVINLQVENELDFYKNCEDPKGYIEALRDMAIKYGITVPIIACVGHFNIEGATGFAENVIPTMNIYPDSDNPKFESYSVKYYEYMKERDYPLMVTETNRNHHMLRRLMLNGTKLLGPFNQVGGTGFGFTNAINNWGKPLSFLASDYNFGGLVNGQGEVSHEFYQSRLLGNFIHLFKGKLGRSQLIEKEIKMIQEDVTKAYPYMLELFEGGYLATATHYEKDEEKLRVEIDGVIFPKNCDLNLRKLQAPFLLYNTPLDFLGLNLTVKFSSLEFSQLFRQDDLFSLIVYTKECGEIQLDLMKKDVKEINCDGSYEFNDHLIINLRDKETCTIKYRDQVLRIITLNPKDASLVKELNGDQIEYINDLHIKSTEYAEEIHYSHQEIPLNQFTALNKLDTKEVKHLEDYGCLRGFGNYQFTFKKDELIKGLLINEVSDICSLYLNNQYKGTHVTCNNHQFFEMDPTDLMNDENEVIVKTEIWGHTNFHDQILPSLKVDALKGLIGCTVIQDIKPIPIENKIIEQVLEITFTYKQDGIERIYLRLTLNQRVKLSLNEKEIGHFSPQHSIADITDYVVKGENQLKISSRETLEINRIELLTGYQTTFKQLNVLDESNLLSLVEQNQDTPTVLPYQVESGNMNVLYAHLDDVSNKCLYALVEGKNLKITAFYNDQLVSRVWLNSENGPRIVGGNGKMIYLPGQYSRKNGNTLKLLIEAISKYEPTELTKINYFVVN